MLKRQIVLTSLSLLILTSLKAAGPSGFVHWSNADLKAFTKKLAPKMNAQKMASEQLGKHGNHSFMVAYRGANGEAELHETQTDVFVAQSGEATLVVGGTVLNVRTTAPGEIRGSGIQGGESKKLGAGDVVHIPAGTPHQLMIDGGKHFTYLVLKIDQPEK